ncbi:TonB-dependent receptor [Pelomonas sp. SE-A7]|uniref:TonB-dependent receptor plug domain-containing protein n=1 Tax=Pelomonas sp. SE-A7 TaxID=3054953 RepID=UPI00259CC3C5|nr:TonB-dependent receptor [Pelomonas sp. SE-A7]MDM4766645.1 TonB-dependent receptor [Pelomonas sp. SE-A7]
MKTRQGVSKKSVSRWLLSGICAAALCAAAHAQALKFDIPAGDLKAALDAYAAQSGAQLIYKAEDVRGRTTKGLRSDLPPAEALRKLLEGTSLAVRTDQSGAVVLFLEAGPKESKKTEYLDVVVISANKRPQRDVAGTITSFSGHALEEAGLKNAEDVFHRAPGIQINKGDPDLSMPTIRGVGTATNANIIGLQQATTGVYIEDVPFTDPIAVNSTADLAPFDLEGLDILRGPQGALYGSSSLGGAIRYTLKKPDLKAFDASLLADLSSVSGGTSHSVYAMLNTPIKTDVAGLRAVVYDRRDAGYIDNLGTGVKNANSLHQRGGRLMATLKPDASLKIGGLYLYQESSIADGFAVSPAPDQLSIDTPTPSTRKGRFSLAQLSIEKQIDKLTLSSSTAQLNKRVYTYGDVTKSWADFGTFFGLPLLPQVTGPGEPVSRAFSQEFRVAGTADKLNFVAGVFYQRYQARYDAKYLAKGGAKLWGDDLVPGDVLYTENDSNRADEKALFGDVEYQLTEQLSLDVGGRFYRNTQRASYDSHLLDALFGVLPVMNVNNSQSGFTPKFNLKYKQGKALWYATASEGYRFGGVNPGVNTEYKSDSVWNYETGLQYAPSRDFNLDFDIFRVNWRDAQMNALVGTGPTAVNGVANVGKAIIDGAELKLVWKPTAALTLRTSLAYIDALTARDFTASNGNFVPSGSRLPGTARFQSSEEIDYRFDGPGESSGRVSLSHSYIGNRKTNLDRPGMVDGYQVFDLRAGLAWNHYELTAYVNNLADSRGSSGGSKVRSLGGTYYNVYYPIKPRSIGISLRYDY